MKNRMFYRLRILLCLILVSIVVIADLKKVFSYTDVPFGITLLCYTCIALWSKSSRIAFSMAFLLCLVMALLYVREGSTVRVERIGIWMYVFLLFGTAHAMFVHIKSMRLPK